LLFRGVDLLDLYRGTLSLRRLHVLVSNTPADDQMWQTIRANQEHSAVTARQAHLLARAAHYAKRRTS
jgi:hypothetical protein